MTASFYFIFIMSNISLHLLNIILLYYTLCESMAFCLWHFVYGDKNFGYKFQTRTSKIVQSSHMVIKFRAWVLKSYAIQPIRMMHQIFIVLWLNNFLVLILVLERFTTARPEHSIYWMRSFDMCFYFFEYITLWV
jgi:hypothetical protein